MQDPEILAKKIRTCVERYGSEQASRAPQIREKIIRFSLGKVGKTFPDFDLPAQSDEDLVRRYGVDHAMKDPDYALFFLHKMGEHSRTGPNGFESKVLQMAWGKILYTGDRRFWRWLPLLGRHKNPDFVVPGPDPERPFRDVSAVIECNGSFWHSERFTGMPLADHEELLVRAYAEVGLRCLVIWESEIKSDPDKVRQRLIEFLGEKFIMPA